MLKKGTRIFAVSAFLLMMTGCIPANQLVGTDEDNLEYIKLVSEGKLDEEGYYINSEYTGRYIEGWSEESTEEEVVQSQGSVHISIAENSYLSMKYFLTDAITKQQTQITGKEFYAEPGDTIHVEWTSENPISNKYVLDTINVYKYIKGSRSLASLDIAYNEEDRTVEIKVPEEGDYSIEPVGRYIDRFLKMNAVIQGTETEVGSWKAYIRADGENYTECDPSKMDPTKNYKVTYSYPYMDYYVSSCTPDDSNVHKADAPGEMTFGPYPPDSDVGSFYLTLHSYLRCRVQGDINAVVNITVDGKDMTAQLKGNKVAEWNYVKYYYLDKMMLDSKVTVDVRSGYELAYTECLTPLDRQSLGDGSSRYTFNIVESDTNIALFYVYKSGKDSAIEYIEQARDCADIKLQFSDEDNRHIPNSGEKINPKQKVEVTIIPKDGYYLTQTTGNSSDGAEIYRYDTEFRYYVKDLDKKLNDCIKKYCKIEFSTADSDGKLEFMLDGAELTGNTIAAKQGQKITFTYVINDSANYQIECRNNAFWDKYKQTFTYSFEVTPELDGKLIDIGFLMEKFNFGVVRK